MLLKITNDRSPVIDDVFFNIPQQGDNEAPIRNINAFGEFFHPRTKIGNDCINSTKVAGHYTHSGFDRIPENMYSSFTQKDIHHAFRSFIQTPGVVVYPQHQTRDVVDDFVDAFADMIEKN